MARFFISDLHIDDDRFYIFNRPFNSLKEQQQVLIDNWNNNIKEDDEVWFLGDFAVTDEGVEFASLLNGQKHLIVGNYDEPRLDLLSKYFLTIQDNKNLLLSNNEVVYLNHYPGSCSSSKFSLCGHIHGTWKVQRNMINVGLDAWNYKLVPEENIKHLYNAIKNYFDANVFAGELESNKKTC